MPQLSNPFVAIVGIIAVAFLEWQAIGHGIDGAYLSAVVAVIAGIAGYAVQPQKKG